MASSSSSSYESDSQNRPRWKYHVFLSFRGADTRRTFTGHLYEGLKHRGIFTFQDDKRLENGDSIPEELLKAIEESQVALVIFSKNYATSSWCLNELVKIMECKEEKGLIVIPVFYDVYPSEVRKQTKSFADAFTKHESEYANDVEGMQMVKGWRTALSDAADLKGCNIHDRIESDCIGELVDDVSSKLCKTSSSYLQDIVGIDTHLEKVKSLLEMETNDVRVLGIWGMGGVGKTTLARAVFDTLSPQFQGASFLADVKETNINEMHSLQNILLSELLREDKKYVNNKGEGKRLMAHRLRFMKVLVVLDDINHHDHWEYLAGELHWFGPGSRIIATTRNKQIIGKNNVVYEVTTLPEHDAIQLFNHYAFKDEALDEHIKKLALEVVRPAKGLPLALRLWGILLLKKDTIMWRKVVDMIKTESSPDIMENLKISFEGLQDKEKTIFLDIACFFRGMRKDDTIEILKSYDLYADIRLHDLIEKSLVFISKYDTIQMHDLIQDMGRHVVTMQKNSGQPSRLWNIEDMEDVMVNNTVLQGILWFRNPHFHQIVSYEIQGTRAIEAIWLTTSKKLSFSKEAMKNMQSLRMIRIQRFSRAFPSDSEDSIEYLPNNLCWFEWHNYRWKLFPENFNPRLVHLDLQSSSLHYLWNETKLQQFLSLRRIDLRYSCNLKRTPDFKGMPNLEYLNLEECRSLEEVHPSLKYCKKLIELNLSYCESLERFPYVNVESLESLNLKYCFSLEKFPEILGRMEQGTARKIMTSHSGIRELPLSLFDHQPHLIELHLDGITNLESLPSSICKSKGLVKLRVSNWSKLESLPEEIGDLENLEELDASYTLISHPPSSIVRLNKLKSLHFRKVKSEDRVYFVFPLVNKGLLSLESLDLSGCNIIDGGLPEDIGSLSSLEKLHLSGNNFEHLPQSISKLGALQWLELSNCKRLTQLPEDIGSLSSLEQLHLSGNNFEHLPQSISKLGTLRWLELSDCKRLTQLPEDIGSLSSLKELRLCGNNFEHLPQSISKLGALQLLYLSNCKRLTQLPEDIGSLSPLKELRLCGNNFEHLPQSISKLGALRWLELSNCKRLTQLPEDIGFLSSLEQLHLSGNNFEHLPQSISKLGTIRWLELSYCKRLTQLPEDIGSLSSLKELRLCGNNFEHLPQSISKLGALQLLYLSDCKRLTQLPEDIGSLSSLKELRLCGNNFEHLPQSISKLGALQLLYLSNCKRLTQLPEDIGSLSSLKELRLCGNNFEHLPQSISKLGALQLLYLTNCKRLTQLPEDIGSLSSLEKLHLSGNNFEHLPQSISKLGALQLLELSNCKRLTQLPEDIGSLSSLKKLHLSGNNFEHLPQSISKLGALRWLELSYCKRLTQLPEDIGSLSSLEQLHLTGNNFEHLPQSISKLGALRWLELSDCKRLTQLPEDIGSLSSLEELYLSGNNFEHLPQSISILGALRWFELSDCKRLTQLPEDIGSLSSLEELHLSGNNFEHLPQSISELGALRLLELSDCKRLTQLPEDIGCLSSLEELHLSGNNFEHLPQSISELGALRLLELSDCKRLTQLPEDIGCLSSLEELHLSGNNFEHFPQSISELGALQLLYLTNCKRLTQLPEFPQQLDRIDADWRNDLICNSLFQNISSLQHDISVSDSLSLRVFRSLADEIPSWFHHQGMGTSVLVNLPENWYVSDNFLGFAVCYYGDYYIDCITAHLIPLCDDGMSSMTQKFALSSHSQYSSHVKFFLVPLGGLWDASNANEKTPNDYGHIKLDVFGEEKKFGVRLLYKDEAELHNGIRKSRDEEEASCSCFYETLAALSHKLGIID
ncbi:hypothetical protein KY285_008914 [Solanum tuberosum]|nr:hypothetical protein KY285_008914 [Solanum tuberosum]